MGGPLRPWPLPTGGLHVGVLGFSNPEWLLEPVARFRVEKLVLLEMPSHDKARSKLRRKGMDLDAELRRVAPDVEVRTVDLWNPGAVARELLKLAERRTVWANISTGPNPWCVAATLAASFAPINVYHVDQAGRGIIRIPSLRQEPPTGRELALLAQLPGGGGEISGKLLKKQLRESHFFRESDSDKPAKNREQGQVNSAMQRPIEWGAIVAGFHGARRWYALGPTGRTLKQMFLTL